MDYMTEEMIKAAEELEVAANRYKKLYQDEFGKKPMVYVKNDETGDLFLISSSEY